MDTANVFFHALNGGRRPWFGHTADAADRPLRRDCGHCAIAGLRAFSATSRPTLVGSWAAVQPCNRLEADAGAAPCNERLAAGSARFHPIELRVCSSSFLVSKGTIPGASQRKRAKWSWPASERHDRSPW